MPVHEYLGCVYVSEDSDMLHIKNKREVRELGSRYKCYECGSKFNIMGTLATACTDAQKTAFLKALSNKRGKACMCNSNKKRQRTDASPRTDPPEAPPREQEEYVQEEVTDWDPLRPASEWKDRELQDYICWMGDKPMRHFLNTA